MTSDNDHDTWVYHALHEAKVVKYSEAVKLYKQGWHDSPSSETLFKGIRGKWYKSIVSYRSFYKRIAPHWDSHKLLMAFLAASAIVVTLFIYLDGKGVENNNKNIEQTSQ